MIFLLIISEKILDNDSLEKYNDHTILNLLEESKNVQQNIKINNSISKL
jgi:hypothetical protein